MMDITEISILNPNNSKIQTKINQQLQNSMKKLNSGLKYWKSKGRMKEIKKRKRIGKDKMDTKKHLKLKTKT